jgi:hypothetical protein
MMLASNGLVNLFCPVLLYYRPQSINAPAADNDLTRFFAYNTFHNAIKIQPTGK